MDINALGWAEQILTRSIEAAPSMALRVNYYILRNVKRKVYVYYLRICD
jgi:hypothetical protein